MDSVLLPALKAFQRKGATSDKTILADEVRTRRL
jgi:hypothetical protein